MNADVYHFWWLFIDFIYSSRLWLGYHIIFLYFHFFPLYFSILKFISWFNSFFWCFIFLLLYRRLAIIHLLFWPLIYLFFIWLWYLIFFWLVLIKSLLFGFNIILFCPTPLILFLSLLFWAIRYFLLLFPLWNFTFSLITLFLWFSNSWTIYFLFLWLSIRLISCTGT